MQMAAGTCPQTRSFCLTSIFHSFPATLVTHSHNAYIPPTGATAPGLKTCSADSHWCVYSTVGGRSGVGEGGGVGDGWQRGGGWKEKKERWGEDKRGWGRTGVALGAFRTLSLTIRLQHVGQSASLAQNQGVSSHVYDCASGFLCVCVCVCVGFPTCMSKQPFVCREQILVLVEPDSSLVTSSAFFCCVITEATLSWPNPSICISQQQGNLGNG